MTFVRFATLSPAILAATQAHAPSTGNLVATRTR